MKFNGRFATLFLFLFLSWGMGLAWADDSPPSSPANGSDPYAVPQGGPQELAAFILNLKQQRPQNVEELKKIQQAMLKAADKILAGKPNDEQLTFAVGIKASALQEPQELTALEDSLKRTGKKLPARLVHARLLTVQIDRARSDNAAIRKQIDEVKKFLSSGSLQPGDDQLAMHACETAAQTDEKLAAGAFEDLAKVFSSQPMFAHVAGIMQGSARRLRLPGNPMPLEGKTLEGKKLDMAAYRGKVVLVDFWATWCGPCMAEVPNIKQIYQNYHEKGFDVVGISLDSITSEKLSEFIKKEEVPWTICRDADSPHRMTEQYGVRSIPTMILMGRDGKVVSLHARGQELGPLVEKALASESPIAESKGSGGKASAEKSADIAKEKKSKAEDVAAAKKKNEELKANAATMRDWSDAGGDFHVKAKFRGIVNKTVKLECDDGRVISVPLEKLSKDDKSYIDSRKR